MRASHKSAAPATLLRPRKWCRGRLFGVVASGSSRVLISPRIKTGAGHRANKPDGHSYFLVGSRRPREPTDVIYRLFREGATNFSKYNQYRANLLDPRKCFWSVLFPFSEPRQFRAGFSRWLLWIRNWLGDFSWFIIPDGFQNPYFDELLAYLNCPWIGLFSSAPV